MLPPNIALLTIQYERLPAAEQAAFSPMPKTRRPEEHVVPSMLNKENIVVLCLSRLESDQRSQIGRFSFAQEKAPVYFTPDASAYNDLFQ